MSDADGKLGTSVRWVVMGVSGCGKSTVGQALAHELGVPFVEGDQFHPAANVAKMSAGIALDDHDRAGWLETLQGRIGEARAHGAGLVVSCSALKRRYRDLLRQGDPALRFVHLDGPRELIAGRMRARAGHYMPPALLESQLRDLEALQADEAGVVLDIGIAPAEQVARILGRGAVTGA
ncbi:gluconokinase [Massilia antarctica]|uniref:gluconokinase n=1 Tax=Massilia antarctica TaxID=2765360 RepID=UPI0006BB6E4C|nr:gluconokinase [Massilia sp. H27-R4]MCY0914206.1 gluconokinase [Massilia sp. H27-R4]CUI08612.1 Gluconokinase [Janthinobacterium sp. CG23_2]CUU32398.1 Gluconokinase [Janthinobacterium sp. CG23_2]